MNNKIKKLIPQILTILFVVLIFGFFTINAQVNMDNRGIDFGFGFLKQEASFDMQYTLLDYDGQDSYAWAYVVALLKLTNKEHFVNEGKINFKGELV